MGHERYLAATSNGGDSVSELDKDSRSADSSTNGTSASESSRSAPETGVEGSANETADPPVKAGKVTADREATEQTAALHDRSRAHEEEIEQLKQALREQNSRLEATTRMLSAMQPAAAAPPDPVQSVQAQPEALPPTQSPPPEKKPSAPAVPSPSSAADQSAAAPTQSGETSASSGPNPAHHEEMERLKERLRDQDARLEATTRLLTSIRIPDPVAANPAPPPQSRAPLFAALGGAATLVIVAGFLYLRSQAARPGDQGQTAALVQPQLAASLPSTAQAPAQLAAAQPPAPELPPQPVAQPVTQPGQEPPMTAPPSQQMPSSTLQIPSAQPPGAQANAEPPPLPLPDSQQGPPPDAIPPPDVAPVERPAVDHLMSQNLTDYLHNHKLPFVEAMVYEKAGNPTSISLSGQVRTETGKEDAETKSRIFLGSETVKVHNRLRINPELAANHLAVGVEAPGASGAPVESAAPEAAANPCVDLCQKDNGHCKVHCQNATVENASGGIASGGLVGGVAAVLGTVAQTGAQSSDCAEDCQQTLEHCTADCNSGGGSNEQSNGPPEGGGGGGEGPDQPPS
jgi:hypothetical protein